MEQTEQAYLLAAPESFDIIKRRWRILHALASGHMGRRPLAEKLRVPERRIRSDIDRLLAASLIRQDAAGLHLKDAGVQEIEILTKTMPDTIACAGLEEQLISLIGNTCMVCPETEDFPVFYHRWFRKEAEVFSLTSCPWISEEERSRLLIRGGAIVMGQVVLSDTGSILHRLRNLEEVQILWTKEDPMSAYRLQIGCSYLPESTLLLSRNQAEQLIEIFTEKRKNHA